MKKRKPTNRPGPTDKHQLLTNVPLHKDVGSGWVFTVEDACDPTDPREEEDLFGSVIYAWAPRADASMWWRTKTAADRRRSLSAGDALRVLHAGEERRLTLKPTENSQPVGIVVYPASRGPSELNVEEKIQDELDWYENYHFGPVYCMHLLKQKESMLHDDHSHPHSLSDLYPEDLTPAVLDEVALELHSLIDGYPKGEITPESIRSADWRPGLWQPPMTQLEDKDPEAR